MPKQSRSQAALMNQPLGHLKKTWRTDWPSGRQVDEKFEILIEYSLKNKESNKKNGAQFPVRMKEIWSKQAQVLPNRMCSYELQLNWSFGETSLPFFSMMWTTRELAMKVL